MAEEEEETDDNKDNVKQDNISNFNIFYERRNLVFQNLAHNI